MPATTPHPPSSTPSARPDRGHEASVDEVRTADAHEPAPRRRVHLDAGGNARLLPEARAAFAQAQSDGWADPRRLSSESRQAAALLNASRAALADAFGARTEEVHLAPSHIAALHAGVRGVTRGRRRVGREVVTSSVERAAVLGAAAFAAQQPSPDGSSGLVTTVPVDATGTVDLERFVDALGSPGIALAALQHSNGEVGTLQPVEQVFTAARAAKVPLLVDAGAAVGHVTIPPAWDVLAADAADWGGPSGIGVLVVRSGVRWQADWPEDEDSWFPGGVSVPAAFAAAVALQTCLADRDAQDLRRRELVAQLRARIPALVPDVDVVGSPALRLPHVLTFSCLYVDGEALVSELDTAGFAVGSGSACTSSALEPSHVLAAMGALTHGNIRIALDRSTTQADVDSFLVELPLAVARVRERLGVGSL